MIEASKDAFEHPIQANGNEVGILIEENDNGLDIDPPTSFS